MPPEGMTSYADIKALAAVMAAFPHSWWFAGGWAIDLFAGEVTREHEDLEIAIFRGHQTALREYLSRWTLEKVIFRPEGNVWGPWLEGEWLELPDFQLRATRAGFTPPEFEIFLNEHDGDEWVSRRDRTIRHEAPTLVGYSSVGISYLTPEVQLLPKAWHHRPKDEHDFALAMERMDRSQKSWLRDALTRLRPDDPWLWKLTPGDS